MKDIIKRITARCGSCKNCKKRVFPTQSGEEIAYQCDTNEFFFDVDPDGWCYQYARRKEDE